MELNRLVEGLGRPEAYPHDARDLEVHQTHISVVFLAGDFAYKVKKPLTLPFLDYGTLERRRHFCHEEVRLNRRLAPDVYLGVVPVVEAAGAPEVRVAPAHAVAATTDAVGRADRVVEWAVRMRRLPEQRTLLYLVEAESLREETVARVAAHVATFHGRASRGPDVSHFARFDAVAENARDNLTQSADQVGRTLHASVHQALSHHLETALMRLRPRIEARARADVACEIHGDLRLDHVYLLEERESPTIIDCIEFNEAFRCADPVADAAFLAMDLDQAGRWDLSAAFSDAYFRASSDEEGRTLLDFYVAYRAAVRGKVQGIKAAEWEVPPEERQRAARIATGHWLLALGTLAPPAERPALVLVGGLPATGKSTLARGLAENARFTVLRSDVVRKELAGLEPDAPSGAEWEKGIYSTAWSDRTYETCRRRAEEILMTGGRVVVDASFHVADRRRAFLDTGVRLGVRTVFLVCEADTAVALERLARRGPDASDAGRAVYEQMQVGWEPSSGPVRRIQESVPTGEASAVSVKRALDILRARGIA